MIFSPSVDTDLEQIKEWIDKDPYHKDQPADWWLTGNGYLSCALQDSIGPVFYLRFDQESDLLRMSTQFAPFEEVSKIRVAKAILKTFPKFIEAMRPKFKGIVFESVSPTLIGFMAKLGFTHSGEGNDYTLMFSHMEN
jgi:hypothetical protein